MHLRTIDVPCRWCSAQPKEPCKTRTGRIYYRQHQRRKELLSYVNDGTLAALLRKHRKAG